MRTDFVEYTDLPRLAAATRAAGVPFAEALDAAEKMPRAESALAELDDLADRLQSELTATWRHRLDERYATFGRVTKIVTAVSLFVLLPTAILLVTFVKIPLWVVPAFVLIPAVLLGAGLAIAEVGARRDYAAAAADFDAAFDALDAAVLGSSQATCPLGARQLLLGPYRAVFGDLATAARAA